MNLGRILLVTQTPRYTF